MLPEIPPGQVIELGLNQADEEEGGVVNCRVTKLKSPSLSMKDSTTSEDFES